jgi:hypothetical protein
MRRGAASRTTRNLGDSAMTDRTAEAIAVLKDVHNRDAEAGVRTAKKVIFAAADLIACERGAEEARRILRIAIAGQTQQSA